MGCAQSTEAIRPNMFQEKLCMHHKTPVAEVYRSVGELGRGAFGVVEKVEHLKTHRHYAMKTVKFANSSERHEFERETDLLRGLHHPNIVRMVETFEDGHHFNIIMEISSGGTLLDQVKARNKPFSEEEAKKIIRALASVVQYLHSRRICHRDLKLENILVETSEDGDRIKLCDFGASTLYKSGASMTKVLGSIAYMAPEVLEGNYTESCDLWSLGVIMYMLLSNKQPFYAKTEDDLVEKILEGEVKYDRPVWEQVSSEAKNLIHKLLNTDASERHTAAQVLADPWIKSTEVPISPEVYDEFVPRVKAFCGYSPLLRASLVAMAFCMSSSQVSLHSTVYNELNTTHNGELTLQELQSAPALTRFKLDMEKIVAALDLQHENGINLLEFVAATLSPEDAADDELLLAAFHVLDCSHRGSITKEDLKALLGEHYTVAMCHDMVKKVDADKDGKLNFEDYAKMMTLPSRLSGKISKAGDNIRRNSDVGPQSVSTENVQRRSVSNVGPIDTEPATKEDALNTIEALRMELAGGIAIVDPEKVDIQVDPVQVSAIEAVS